MRPQRPCHHMDGVAALRVSPGPSRETQGHQVLELVSASSFSKPGPGMFPHSQVCWMWGGRPAGPRRGPRTG